MSTVRQHEISIKTSKANIIGLQQTGL